MKDLWNPAELGLYRIKLRKGVPVKGAIEGISALNP